MNTNEIQTLGLTETENKIVKNEILPLIQKAFSEDKDVSELIKEIYRILRVLGSNKHMVRTYFTNVTISPYVADIGGKRYKILIQRGL